MRILAGDVGGTKTALALYEQGAAGQRTLHAATYASPAHASLVEVLDAFLAAAPSRVDVAAFGVAGPVRGGVCETTNLPWTISEAELTRRLGVKAIVVNDLHAAAFGVRALAAVDAHVLQAGVPDPAGPIAVIGAGTGLGESIGWPSGRGLHVVSGEGGHADYAPRNTTELRLLQFLSARYGHVSWERVVSGMALVDLYDFVVADGQAPDDPLTRARVAAERSSAAIGERGLGGQDPAASLALDLLVSGLAAEAGNLALRVLPTGGLYLVGGVARHLLPRMAAGAFMAGFLDKGRMSKILENIPVSVVTDPEVGLLGARALGALSSKS